VREKTERGRLSWVAALGLALLVGGSYLYLHDSSVVAEAGPTAPATSTTPRPQLPESTEGAVLSRLERPDYRPGVPHELVIDSLGIDADVVPIAAAGDTLVPPSDPQVLGWWSAGARAGDPGSTLITGHTVHTGGGALDDLEQVQPGDEITVRTGKGVIRYTAKRVKIFSKGTLAQDAERLFSQSSPQRLVIVTCEDWNGVQYLSNVVVTARPTRF
jgi:LPXTG-site transpeptidase (sortase) family protein